MKISPNSKYIGPKIKEEKIKLNLMFIDYYEEIPSNLLANCCTWVCVSGCSSCHGPPCTD